MPTVTSTASHARTVGSLANLTFAHTSNSDTLYVLVEGWNFNSMTATYSGVPMELGGFASAPGSKRIAVFFLSNPPVGTANVVLTPAPWITAGAFNVSGVDIDAPVRNFVFASGTSTTPTVNVTSVVGDLVVAITGHYQTNVTFTVGAGQTSLWAQSGISADDSDRSAGSWEAGAATVTMSWTMSASSGWTIAGFSIPADGTVSPQPVRVTQTNLEVLTSQVVNPIARVSQTNIEVLAAQVIDTSARVSQTVVEVLTAANLSPPARVTQTFIEVLVQQGGASAPVVGGPFLGESQGTVWIE